MRPPELGKEIIEINLSEAIAEVQRANGLIVTMSPGQWDVLLQITYDGGGPIFAIDKNEQLVKAYRKREVERPAKARKKAKV